MVDFSDNSDVNSDDIAQIVEDIDNLDNILLNDSFKKLPQRATKEAKDSGSRLGSETKKKVMFQDLNDDDPLADLLSEDDPQPKKKDSAAARSKSNIMENLFGIKSSDSTPNVTSSEKQVNPAISTSSIPTARQTRTSANLDSLLELKEAAPKESSLAQSHVPRKRPASVNEDVTAVLPDKSRPTDEKSKKSSLMEDLFGTKASSSQNLGPRRSATKLGIETSTPQPTMDQRSGIVGQEQPARSQVSGYAPTISAPRESRRGRRTSGIISDPLGLLSSSLPPEQTLDAIGPSRKESFASLKSTTETSQSDNLNKSTEGLPEWLGGTKKVEDKKETTKDAVPPSPQQNIAKDKVPLNPVVDVRPEDSQSSRRIDVQQELTKDGSLYPEHLSILTRTQIDQQAAIMTMQQQEHELRTAVTLSHQNDQLSQLLEVQKSKLNEQEKQFNLLIKKQMERQMLLESQMKAQQNRIDQYIQTLMAQPMSLPTAIVHPVSTNLEDGGKVSDGKDVDKETELLDQVQRLETEKSSLEFTLSGLNAKHENEMMVQEKLYTRQISFLEEAIEKLEKRMRQELESLEADHEAKIEKLREEKMQIEQYHRDEIENLKKGHIQFVEDIYKRHSFNLKLLQKEHSETIENIAKAKELDDVAMTTIANHKTDLENILQRATVVLDTCKTVHEKIEQRDESLDNEKENLLRRQEDDLKMRQNDVGRHMTFLEKGHDKLAEVAQKLDSYVNQFAIVSQKQSVQCTESEERLSKKEQQLAQERELFEEKVKWERNHLQVMKESWIKEQERQLKALAEERQAVLAEKTKLEVVNRLQIGADDVKKMEIESMTKAAQDAIAYANQERLNWRNKINELDMQQRQLEDKENQLVVRAKELENLTQAALAKRDEGLRALKEAQYLENRYKERLGMMQVQLEAIAQRENKIATEKFTLARERLALRVLEKPEKDVKVSASQKQQDEPSLLRDLPAMSTSHFTDIVDPHLILLKLDLDKQLDTSNKYLDTMQT